jgi:hypothetical protein
MATDTSYVEELRTEFLDIGRDGENFFKNTISRVNAQVGPEGVWTYPDPWTQLTEDERELANQIRRRLADFGPRLIEAVRKSALLEQTDEAETKRLLRSLAASFLLKEFTYRSSYVVSEEDRVFGIVPAEQEETPSRLPECLNRFRLDGRQILDKIDLLAPTPENLARAIVSSQAPGVLKSRPNTAFIMMQIDEQIPRLEDVKNCIKEVFKFGITALRALTKSSIPIWSRKGSLMR